MSKKVFVARPIPEEGIKLMREKGFQVDVNPTDRVLSKEELKEAIAGYDGVLALLSDKIDGEVLDAAGKQLKIVANYAVGYDNIDVKAATERKVFVTNTPGVLTEAVAEHAFTLLLSVAKRIVEADSFVRAGKFKQWEPLDFLGPQIWGKTIGIIGLGRIGSFVAQIAHGGFNMEVLYHDVVKNEEFEMRFSAKYRELPDLLKMSDFVSVHVPLIPATRHLISAKEFGQMKPTAILINTSRGPVVDEVALVEALKVKKIAGAGLDVYEHEPQLTPGLVDLPNVVLTPHTASATHEARSAMSKIAAENIIAALEGKQPPNLVKQ
ncbi:MAG: D-glycerate dehydrogenase [Candidatus Woykebacteria bacterium GWB1_45_5]|uniref:D-glycerate dehydrogenase n=2 Tax=Candidatus Woykeibacteriota TaxID=1817899 RepID=A0A1G1W4W1_9BACT|nr:MAG: D-glycerate dehydrogenase [Candidatus Woykebacteria bacterium GWA1_44_8]OGY23612.1 MAG: D-glycerate dehydrogenase [Candidatus Woykebacteria bacterium GWB1_45_5]